MSIYAVDDLETISAVSIDAFDAVDVVSLAVDDPNTKGVVSIYAVDDLETVGAVSVDAFLLTVGAAADDAFEDAMVEDCCINFTHDLKLLSALSIKCSRT